MDSPVSARAWRPQGFDQVVGQRHVTVALQNAVRRDKVAHAYLFSGIRGVGKTTLARILAKGLNCTDPAPPCNHCDLCREIMEGRSVDVIEIDGASNTGVDDVRELREMARYLPMRGRRKVYIIDEAHMLSKAAFNALLKIIEEPPAHLVFIMATTDIHNMPATILSRCQHFFLRRLTRQEIVGQLSRVAEERKVTVSERGLTLIARASGGSMRDALTLFDQSVAYAGDEVTEADLLLLLGRAGQETHRQLVDAMGRNDAPTCLKIAADLANQGHNLRQFVTDLLEHLRHLIVAKNVPQEDGLIDLPKEEIDEIYTQSQAFSPESLQRLFNLFVGLAGDLRTAAQPFLLFEVALMKAVLLSDFQPIEEVIARLLALDHPRSAPKPDTQPHSNLLPPSRPEIKPSPMPTSVPVTSRVSPPPPVPSPPSAPFTEQHWLHLLDAVRGEKPSLTSYLSQGKWIAADDRLIRIGFSEKTSFLMELLQTGENNLWLSDAVQRHSNRKVRFERIADSPARPQAAASPIPPPPRPEASPRPDVKAQPSLVLEALSVFGGKVIEKEKGQGLF